LLNEGTTGFYGIANDGLDGGIGVYDGYSDANKWLTLTNGLGKTEAGPTDVSSVISTGPYSIKADSTLEIAFSLSAGIDLTSIQNSVINSRAKYASVITDVLENNSELPIEFSLSQNYPNPFNPSTTIRYSIPNNVNRESEIVSLVVYNMLGQKVATLINQNQKAGNYEVKFDAAHLNSGVYFYRLTANGFQSTKKLMLLK